MFCRSCGAQIADNSVFCTNCGVRIQPVGAAAQETAAVPVESAAQTEEIQAEPVQEGVTAGSTAQTEAAQAGPAQEGMTAGSAAQTEAAQAEPAQEGMTAGSTAQTEAAQAEPAQEGMTAGSTAQTDEAQAEPVQENAAADGQQPLPMNGAPNVQTPNGQPPMPMAGAPNVQTPNGQPPMPMNGAPNGQTPNGQPPMPMAGAPNVQTPNGQPPMPMNGAMNGQMPNGQPLPIPMNGAMNGQMPNGQPPIPMNGAMNGQMPYGQAQMQMNGMPNGQGAGTPKKPFVIPAAVNVIGGILAAAAAACFVCVLLFGKPEEKGSDLAVSTLAIPAQQQPVGNGDELNVDLSSVVYQLDIPETDGYRQAQELLEGFIIEDSNTRYLELSDLFAYTDDELWYAYYEILARAGVDLSEVDDDMHVYFQRKNWYEPTISLVNILNDIDTEQYEHYMEILERGEDPSYHILLDEGILNEVEVFNMILIEEYIGSSSHEETEDVLDDLLEE